MSNITFKADDELIKKVRKIAIEKNTTLTQMLRDYLASVARQADEQKQMALKKLDQSFARYSRDMGERKWRREDLYDRTRADLY